MALHRYALTNNGKHLVEQRKVLFGWRTLRYLDSPIRKEEEEMLKLREKYIEHARKRLALQDEYDARVKEIKDSEFEVGDAGKPFGVAAGIVGWLKSFFTEPMHREQKPDWKDVYDLLKGKGLFKSATRKVTVVPSAITVGTQVHELRQQQQNGKGKNRGGGQQQQQQNQPHHQG